MIGFLEAFVAFFFWQQHVLFFSLFGGRVGKFGSPLSCYSSGNRIDSPANKASDVGVGRGIRFDRGLVGGDLGVQPFLNRSAGSLYCFFGISGGLDSLE